LVTLPNGDALLARIGVQPHYVAADPDLFDNHGLKDPAQARAALELIEAHGNEDGGPVAFEHAVIYMRFDEEALKAIAGITEGEYFHAGSAIDLQNVYKNLTAKLTLERGNTELSALFGAAAALFALVAATLSLLWVHRPY
jgi:hypothetical protein